MDAKAFPGGVVTALFDRPLSFRHQMLCLLPALLLPLLIGCGAYHRYHTYQNSTMCREEREWCEKCRKAETEEERTDLCGACGKFKQKCVEAMDQGVP